MACPQDCTETLEEVCAIVDGCCGNLSPAKAETLQVKLLLCLLQYAAAAAIPPDYTKGNVGPISDTADHEVIPAPGAGKRLKLTGISGSNGSSGVPTYVVLKEDGTEFKRFFTSPGGGGFEARGVVLAENTALVMANITNGGETYVSAEGEIIDA